MYKKLFACSLLCLFLLSGAINNAYASAPTLTSDHWSVSLDKPVFDEPNMSKPNSTANMYSLRLKNTGEKAFNVRVQAFRDEPGSKMQLQLAVGDGIVAPNWEIGRELTLHKNLPVSVKADDIEVVVYWETSEDQDKKAARTWKQSFHFKQKTLSP